MDGGLLPEKPAGIVSRLRWTLILIVTLDFVVPILMAENRGEGGKLSFLALAERAIGLRTGLLPAVGIPGTALFFGDAIIAPAISALSAIVPLMLGNAAFESQMLPMPLGTLVALICVQSRGTGSVSAPFGPVILGGLLVMGARGLWHICDSRGVHAALTPALAAQLPATHGAGALPILAAVLLAVTGTKARCADVDHFGRRPSRNARSTLAPPTLALAHLGQVEDANVPRPLALARKRLRGSTS